MKFTINRKTWLRGDKRSFLLRAGDGKMCRLGHVACQLGAKPSQIENIGTIFTASTNGANVLSPLMDDVGRELPYLTSAYEANDDETIDDAIRESRLTALFAANGHELVFVD